MDVQDGLWASWVVDFHNWPQPRHARTRQVKPIENPADSGSLLRCDTSHADRHNIYKVGRLCIHSSTSAQPSLYSDSSTTLDQEQQIEPNIMSFPIPSDKIEARHYINGAFTESSDKGTFALKSPFSHEKIVDVCEATVEDTNRAVAAAKAAFPAWADLSVAVRGSFLRKMGALIREAHQELSQLDAMAMGRPVSTYFDAMMAADYFEHYAGAGWDAQGTTSLNSTGFVNMTFRQPIGPVAAIIPWNVPTMMFAMKIAPALAAGCTVVLKSSEKAPLSVRLCSPMYLRSLRTNRDAVC